MGKFKFLKQLSLALLMGISIVSCSDDDNDKITQISISNSQQLNQTAYADEENTGSGFTFTANQVWTFIIWA